MCRPNARSDAPRRDLTSLHQFVEVDEKNVAALSALQRVGDVVDVAGEGVECLLRRTGVADPGIYPLVEGASVGFGGWP